MTTSSATIRGAEWLSSHAASITICSRRSAGRKLAAPDWNYDADASNWNAFVPEPEALYNRIEFLKP